MKNRKTSKFFIILLLFMTMLVILGSYSAGGTSITELRFIKNYPRRFSRLVMTDTRNGYGDAIAAVSAAPPDEKLPARSASDSEKKIEVRGEAVIYVKPDVAVLNLGISQKSTAAADAQILATSVLNNIILILKNEEIDDNDIQTSYYSIYPEYSYQKSGNVLNGYTVSCSLKVKVRNTEKAGRILQKAIQSGSNSSSGISYELSDNKEYYRNALKLAVMDAEAKVQNIAECIGLKQPVLIKIEEQHTGYGNIRSLAYADSEASGINIMPGKIEVAASVKVLYSF